MKIDEFRARIKLILETYQDNPTFVKIPPVQIEHMIDIIVSETEDLICECHTY